MDMYSDQSTRLCRLCKLISLQNYAKQLKGRIYPHNFSWLLIRPNVDNLKVNRLKKPCLTKKEKREDTHLFWLNLHIIILSEVIKKNCLSSDNGWY